MATAAFYNCCSSLIEDAPQILLNGEEAVPQSEILPGPAKPHQQLTSPIKRTPIDRKAMASIASLQDYPLQPPPPGQSSNFDDPVSRGPAIRAICYAFIVLMWPFVFLRLYSKVRVIRKPGWEDASSVLAAVGATAYAGGVIWSIDKGYLGPHQWDVRATVITPQLVKIQVLLAGTAVYSIAMNFAKIALFLLYYRIFSSSRAATIAIYLGILLSSCYYISVTIVLLALCIPRSHETWTSPVSIARCKPTTKLGIPGGVFNLVSDLYILILPLPLLWGLQMPLRKKIGLTALFLTGLMAIVASSIGLHYRIAESSGYDLTWFQTPAAGLAVVEVTIGVICGSVPNLPALFRQQANPYKRVATFVRGLLSSHGTRSKEVLPLSEYKNLEAKEGTPQKMRVETQVLGPIHGNGTFTTTGMFSIFDGNEPATERSGSAAFLDDASATRRWTHEMPANTRALGSPKPPEPLALKEVLSNEAESPPAPKESLSSEAAAGDELSGSRKEYWDPIRK